MLTQENKDYLKYILNIKLHKHQANVKKYESYINSDSELATKRSLHEFMEMDKKHIAEIESILKNLED